MIDKRKKCDIIYRRVKAKCIPAFTPLYYALAKSCCSHGFAFYIQKSPALDRQGVLILHFNLAVLVLN